MTIDDIKTNIDAEILMIKELNKFYDGYVSSNKNEKKLYAGLVNSLVKRIRLVNDSLGTLINAVASFKKLTPQEKAEVDAQIIQAKDANVALARGKEDFLKELDISEALLKKLKKKGLKKEKKKSEYRKPSLYGKFSNKFFLDTSERLVQQGKMKNLTLNVRRSNMNILSTTYISMMFMSMVIAGIIGIFILIFFILFQISFTPPYLSLYDGNYFIRILKLLWIPFASALFTFIGFYLYPGAEKSSLGKRIDSELPFVVIHMGSISGSGIEPLELLKIVGSSKEYKYAGAEVNKLINQTNIYGYDLSTALRNVALSTPSSKFAELLTGMSVTINSGGDIKKFFEKRAESLLLEYRLEREKSTKTAETFMDLYISIVIATPMILLMILMMVSVAGIQTGFSPEALTIAIIGIVAIINILFLTFLHLKQPTY